MINDVVLEKTETKRTFIRNIRKTQLKILERIMRKDGVENEILTGKSESKVDRRKKRVNLIRVLV